MRTTWPSTVGDLPRRLVPPVEERDIGQRAAAQRSVVPAGPTHHDVAGEHPVVGDADGLTQEWLARIRGPAGETRPQALGAGGQEEVLHRREDRATEHAAEIVVWGFGDQPCWQLPAPGLGNRGQEELAEAFQLLTGMAPRCDTETPEPAPAAAAQVLD